MRRSASLVDKHYRADKQNLTRHLHFFSASIGLNLPHPYKKIKL
ncbi:hypothetical protein HMPREF1248_1552 [Coriobacteriaceae bacterium BV3Ac1]|nr:hypothetical protein HMPREF1248_1552 [Coriobacteriaceae bacterium BV3Ac1]